jgi:energy-coupling factor transport system ATP-binding protein
LKIKNLSVAYNGKTVINNLNLSINRGEVVALMGRNGAGKSSLLTSAVGINENARGEITICGKALAKTPINERMNLVGYVPQEPSDLLYHRSVAPRMCQR